MDSLQRLQNGIQIDMRAMDRVEVLPDGKHATVGGGSKQLELIQALAAVGKRTGELLLFMQWRHTSNFHHSPAFANASAWESSSGEAVASCRVSMD